MSLTAGDVIGLLERRYDYHSARTVFRATCAQAGIDAGASFDSAKVEAFATALQAGGDRTDSVASALRAAAPAKPAPAKPEPVKAPAPAAAKPAEAKPAEAAPATPVAAKPERGAQQGHRGKNRGRGGKPANQPPKG